MGAGGSIRTIRNQINRLVKRLKIDALYLQFWKICNTESIEIQREIWGGIWAPDQESLYRVLNSLAPPKYPCPPLPSKFEHPTYNFEQLPSVLTIQYQKNLSSGSIPGQTLERSTSESVSAKSSSQYTMRFVGQSHANRLLQMHQYFEQVLQIKITYYSRIALVVALATKGNMITVTRLFRQWQQASHSQDDNTASPTTPSSKTEAVLAGGGGKELYSAVIRGLIGRNYQDNQRRSFYVSKDFTTGVRNQGMTQVYAAMELFYDLLRRGGTPTFEMYHSLVMGLAVFKNDMEASELLLDHMIMMKKKPYVQVLHIMCREYARRKDFASVERIFGMLQEYRIQPRALTCNIMLKAIFQMSTPEALQYLEQSGYQLSLDQSQDDTNPEMMVQQLKRQKIRELREYMRHNSTPQDEATFSTLFYGYGHLREGYPDLKEAMIEMSKTQPPMKPSLIVLNSLLFAHLNHGRIKKAEAILDEMLQTTLPVNAPPAWKGRYRLQSQSPFQKRDKDTFQADITTAANASETRSYFITPGKGSFHALMLAHVEQGDITGMERVLDKMIQANYRQQHQQQQKPHPHHRSNLRSVFWSMTLVDLEADEHTANIMLLGYLMQRDHARVDMIERQIQARPDWKSSSMFLSRDENRQVLIDLVKQKSSREVVQRSLLESEEEDDLPARQTTVTTEETLTDHPQSLGEDPEGELDDDFEIDVTTLSAKLRGLMSTSTSSPSASQSTPPSST
ncbi:hypothetical protein BG011_006435 [Mortierella polycephala]|uniref:Pentatricopeptide repeat-containing protein n=1 Tax=Mortierella polycephala TaxID=41804 RepID=A0A9P6TZJ7_9FUNG|nr:hypothetical protein BG011_006435 [Mortierella polycephala]